MAKKHKLLPKKKAKQNIQKLKKIKKVQQKKEKVAKITKNYTNKKESEIITQSKKPTHYSQLDPTKMYVKELVTELQLRGLSTKGKKELLKVRLELRLSTEKNVEEKKLGQK